jgi:hypothetical protein
VVGSTDGEPGAAGVGAGVKTSLAPTIKLILGIKDPEGPKVAQVPRTAQLIDVPPHQEKPVKISKHRTGPLMLKVKRQALEKIRLERDSEFSARSEGRSM